MRPSASGTRLWRGTTTSGGGCLSPTSTPSAPSSSTSTLRSSAAPLSASTSATAALVRPGGWLVAQDRSCIASAQNGNVGMAGDSQGLFLPPMAGSMRSQGCCAQGFMLGGRLPAALQDPAALPASCQALPASDRLAQALSTTACLCQAAGCSSAGCTFVWTLLARQGANEEGASMDRTPFQLHIDRHAATAYCECPLKGHAAGPMTQGLAAC